MRSQIIEAGVGAVEVVLGQPGKLSLMSLKGPISASINKIIVK